MWTGEAVQSLVVENNLIFCTFRLMETTRVLPCCLVNGDVTILSALFKALEKRFDTIIYPMNFLPEHLKWMLAMWSMLEKTEPKHKQVGSNLKYSGA